MNEVIPTERDRETAESQRADKRLYVQELFLAANLSISNEVMIAERGAPEIKDAVTQTIASKSSVPIASNAGSRPMSTRPKLLMSRRTTTVTTDKISVTSANPSLVHAAAAPRVADTSNRFIPSRLLRKDRHAALTAAENQVTGQN